MKSIDDAHAAKCPRTYIMWTFVVAGMVFAFIVYIFITDPMAEFADSDTGAVLPVSTSSNNVILTEHTNEEDDYEKPVCKRLEESGERY